MVTDPFIQITVEKLFPILFNALTNPHLSMVSKSTLYVFETFLIHHCDQFNHHSQCDYTLEEKVTIHTHMIYCCKDNNMNFTNGIFLNSYTYTIKLLWVPNILVTNVNIGQNGNWPFTTTLSQYRNVSNVKKFN